MFTKVLIIVAKILFVVALVMTGVFFEAGIYRSAFACIMCATSLYLNLKVIDE